jgi:hypothetical protein
LAGRVEVARGEVVEGGVEVVVVVAAVVEGAMARAEVDEGGTS